MTSRTLEHATLVDRGACKPARGMFLELFGTKVEVTEVLCLQHAADFDWDWAIEELLSPMAQAEREKAMVAARAEYRKARVAAQAEYEKARVAARAEREKSRVAAWAEYEKSMAAAWAEHEKARVAAWARAYIADGEIGE